MLPQRRSSGLRPASFGFMPRILRSQLPDGFFHITARGVDGTAIVRDDHDRLAFLELLAKTVDRYGWTVYTFCLMTNHYHAIVETTQPKLSAGVQYLSGRHAQRFNLRHGRRGHLFGARFASWVIASEGHFEDAREYVRQNPVKAGLCVDPDEYRWAGDRSIRTRVRSVEWLSHGRRRARCPWRPRAQPQGHHRPAAAEPPDLHHRPLRVRQVEPCLRHDLRRGPAPLRGIPQRLRAPVPPDDGEAGRRPHRRPQPGHLDRPEDDLAQPAVDGRHGHGDLRL